MSKGLVVDDLSITFNRQQLEVVNELTLQIGPGEALGLVGESGSGKSLTARARLGLLPTGAVASGKVTFDDVSLLDLPLHEMQKLRGARIAMIFQDPMSSLNPVLRVGEAIAQVIRSHEPVGSADAHRRAVDLMDRVGIRDPKERSRAYPHQFSGGMRQRIMIAMALAADPALLLADEPTTALDVVVQAGILRLLACLSRPRGRRTRIRSCCGHVCGTNRRGRPDVRSPASAAYALYNRLDSVRPARPCAGQADFHTGDATAIRYTIARLPVCVALSAGN